MAKRKRSPELTNLIKEFMERSGRLINDYGVATNHIAFAIGESPASFFKYALGKLPETKPNKIMAMNIKMEKFEKELEKSGSQTTKTSSPTNNSNTVDELENNYKINPTLKDIDHEIDVLDAAAEPEIRVGSRIGIKKIDIGDCEWGKYHYIMDTLQQPYLRRIYNNGDVTYRLVAETEKYPDLHFEKSKIAEVYKVVYVKYKPK